MANDSITFNCPACGTFLTVPGELAGVSGPCPTCGNAIQAPASSSPESAGVVASPPATIPATITSNAGEEISPVESLPPPAGPLTLPRRDTPADPAIQRLEPRQRPKHQSNLESFSKKVADGAGQEIRPAYGVQTVAPVSARIIRILLPLVFVLLIVAAVFAILKILASRSHTAPVFGKLTLPIRAPETYRSPAESPPPPTQLSEPFAENSVTPPPILPEGIEPINPAKEAYAVLEKFLAARTLEERLPLLETQTTESDLARSFLAAPLPAASGISLAARDSNPVEQVTDWFYHVDLALANATSFPAIILVRKRGGSDPKIVADPLLDSFGGRLAAFAKEPSTRAEVFQVIALPLASCTDENVPNNEKKLTLKLLSRENGDEISRAYFGRQSRIGLTLEDGTRGLRFGMARPCTVMLRWNSEDDPDQPYLEAINLKSMDWNP